MNAKLLTKKEQAVVFHLVKAWNAFVKTMPEHPCDLDEFRRSINTCQMLMSWRVAKRLDPETWTAKTKKQTKKK